MQRRGPYHIALHVPVCGPASVVEEIRRRQAGVPAIDTSELPSTKDAVYHFIGIAQQPSAAPHRQLPYSIEVDDVAHVKVGIGIPVTLSDRIQDKSVAESCAWQTACLQT